MRPSHWSGAQQQQKAPHQTLPNNQHLQHSHKSPLSSTAVQQQQPQIGRQSVRQRHESGCAQSVSPPAVVLIPDAPNGSLPGGMANNRLPNRPGGQSAAFLVRNPSVDIQSPGDPDFLAGHKTAAQPTSRSPSASSLASTGGTLTTTTNNNTLGNCSPHHCSPNPSPPPGGVPPPATQPRIGPTRVQTAGSASVARMMSALLKQQNSIAEEEPDLELPNGQVPSGTPPTTAAAVSNDERQQKCWLAPPDHTLLGGNISPPPTRIHPLQDPELRKEIPIVHQSGHSQNNSQSMANELGRHIVAMATPIAAAPASPSAASVHHHQQQQQQQQQQVQREREDGGRGWSRQQSQPWHTGRGATNKHRKGSLSPNNSLRYSTLMAAATRRNHFQQQRTTSEATPAQRDQLMADVLGHGIREQCICASVSAPSPRLMASSVGVACCSSDHNGTNSTTTSHHSCSLRFELGGGDSSASSLNGHPPGGGGHCSQCSSANSLQRAGSIRQRPVPRGRLHTADGGYSSDPPHNPHHEGRCSPASGSLPKLVSLVPPSFPPASSMLSSSDSEQRDSRDFSKKRQKEGGERSPSRVAEWHAKVPKLSTDEEPTNNNNNNRETSADANANKVTLANGGHRLCPPPSISAAAAVLRRDPARWNLAATKQRSSSESAFNVMPKLAIDCGQGDGQCACCVCTCAACQQIPTIGGKCGEQQRASFAMESSSTACRSCPHGQGGTVGQGTAMRRPDSMSALSSQPRHRPGCTTIAFLQQNEREQAILQRILGPAGLGWLKRDPLLKKSLSLVLTDGDVEAQRNHQHQGSAISVGPVGGGLPGGGGPASEKGGGSILDESNCSVKQPLMREKERGGRFIKRQQLFNKRRVTSDYALFFALFGIVLMIVENEFNYAKHVGVCTALKTVIMMSTIILVGLVVKFHVHEIQIFMNANSAEDWQIALTWRKTMQILVEIVACAICPLPIPYEVEVSTVNSDGQTIPMKMPLDVLFSIMMFFRLYWLCRVMLLHSRLFTDAASRSIAGLNRVKTDAKFILKTLMTICPGTVLMLFTATLWMIGGYILRLCERHHDMEADDMISVQAEKHQSYLNSLWLIAVTFLSIGYGDIVPNTQCGRIMAVVTGILGTCTSSMVVAVIARKLELTRAEKHVHNFMIETQHTKEMKHIAANVLRETWLIYKNRRLVEKIDPSKIRYHQRKFLVAICALRKLKTSQRKLDENRISLGDVAKTTSHSHELMRDVHTTQEGMALRITAVEHQLSDIQRELSGISELLKFALRPQIEHGCAAPATPQTPAAQQPQPAAPNLMMLSGQQSLVENLRLQQRRKPSTISEPPS